MATNLLLSPEIRATYNRRLLSRFRAKTLFTKFAEEASIPRNGGMAMSWRRMETIRPVATASTSSWPADATYTSATGALLTEGTFHTPSVIASWAEVTATVRQYGLASFLSDVAIEQQIDSPVPEYTENYGEALAELADLVVRDVLLGAGTIQYANAKTSASAIISGDFISLTELRKAKRTLARNNAEPIDGQYVVLAHPDALFDLEGDSNITNVWTYGGAGRGDAKTNELFDVAMANLPMGFRLYTTTLCPISRASGYGDVYNTFVFGRQFYGGVKLSAMPPKVIVHPPGSAGAADPLDQVGTIGAKLAYAAALLNNGNGILLRHQCSAYTGTRAGL